MSIGHPPIAGDLRINRRGMHVLKLLIDKFKVVFAIFENYFFLGDFYP